MQIHCSRGEGGLKNRELCRSVQETHCICTVVWGKFKPGSAFRNNEDFGDKQLRGAWELCESNKLNL